MKRYSGRGAHRKNKKQRAVRLRRAVCTAAYLAVLTVAALGWLYSSLPETIYVVRGQSVRLARFSYLSPLGEAGVQHTVSTRELGSYNTTLSLGGLVPIKTVRTVVTERPVVTVCGMPFGIKMFSDGALVVGFSDFSTDFGAANPAKEAGLRMGDLVVSMNGVHTKNNDAVRLALTQSQGQPVEVVYLRNGEQRSATLTPLWDEAEQAWKAGMWVRDSSAGVGTLTFVDDSSGIFAGLGHAISDGDTGETVTLRLGEIVPCEITGYSAGTAGSPGELKGQFISAHAVGTILVNGESGVYGTVRTVFEGEAMEVAFAQEVKTGTAELWTTIAGEAPQAYTVEIEKISDAGNTRNLVLHVTDTRLLKQTGGIVQGMSGSPVVQNGKLVGAVTHVLVNDPTRGYGIFAQTMLEEAQQVAQERAA